MSDPIEFPNTEPMQVPRCATCRTPIEVPAGADGRVMMCGSCNAKLQALIDNPEPAPPVPNVPRDPSGGSVPATPLRDAVMAASAEKAPELEKALDEARATVIQTPLTVFSGDAPPDAPSIDEVLAIEHANYCKTKATEPGSCSCGADPSIPPLEETPPPIPVRKDPILFSADKARALKCVDICGNGPGYIINVHDTGEIIPHPSGLQVAFTPNGVAAIFGIPTEFLDGPEVPPEKRRIQITNVRVMVGKMLMCTRPSIVRLKNKSDEWWGAATAMLHDLDDTDRFEYATAAPDETPTPAPEPANLPDQPIQVPVGAEKWDWSEKVVESTPELKETTDGQTDPPAPAEPQS